MDTTGIVVVSSKDEDEGTEQAKTTKWTNMSSLSETTVEAVGPYLLDLSDDVLLIIFSFLQQVDIISLGHTCSRLETLIVDRTLWLDVDCRGQSLDTATFRLALSNLMPSTRSLALDLSRVTDCAEGREDELAEAAVRRASECAALQAFTLENARIDACRVQIKHFPSRLTYWSLKGSTVEDLPFERSYFMDLNRYMPNLQTLVLSECPWFQAHSLMAIAKCPLLRELRLDGCVHLGNCMAYCSMSARFAFKSLETLDIRRTRLSDAEIGCFNRVTTLRHLLAESLSDSDRLELAQNVVDDSVTCRVLPSRCMIVLDRVNNEYIVNRQVVLRPDIHEDEINHIIRNVDSMDRFIDQGRACVEGAAPNHVEIRPNSARKIYIDIDVFGRRAEARQNADGGANDDGAGPSGEPQRRNPEGKPQPSETKDCNPEDSDDDEDLAPTAPAARDPTADGADAMDAEAAAHRAAIAHYAVEDSPFAPTDFAGPDFIVRQALPRVPDFIVREALPGSAEQPYQRVIYLATREECAAICPHHGADGTDANGEQGERACDSHQARAPGPACPAASKRKLEDAGNKAGPSGVAKVQRRTSDVQDELQAEGERKSDGTIPETGTNRSGGEALTAFLPHITLTSRTAYRAASLDNDSDSQHPKTANGRNGTNETHRNACGDRCENAAKQREIAAEGGKPKRAEDNDVDDSSGESEPESDKAQAATSKFVGGRGVCGHYRSRRRTRDGGAKPAVVNDDAAADADEEAANFAMAVAGQAPQYNWRRIMRERMGGPVNGCGKGQGPRRAQGRHLGATPRTRLRAAAKKALLQLGEKWDAQSSSDEDMAEQARLELLVRCARKSRGSGEPVVAADPGPSRATPYDRADGKPALAGPSASAACNAGLTAAGPSGAGPSNAGPSIAGPSGSGPSHHGPGISKMCMAGPRVALPGEAAADVAVAGPSNADASLDGPNTVGPGEPGPSGAGPSNAEPNDAAAGDLNRDVPVRVSACPRRVRNSRGRASCVRFLVPPAARLITDAAVHDLFAGDADWPYMVRIAAEPAPRSQLETLVLRGFPGITDQSLRVLASVPSLRTLDVTGTGVTAHGVAAFRALRPEVELLASFE